jgi:hypothetical protein
MRLIYLSIYILVKPSLLKEIFALLGIAGALKTSSLQQGQQSSYLVPTTPII